MKEVEENVVQKSTSFRQLESINLSEFLPDDLSKQELDELMTRTGIVDPTSEESVKFLLLAVSKTFTVQNNLGYFDDPTKLDAKQKKRLGREFIHAIKNHPVVGEVEVKEGESAKLKVIDNLAWYGNIMNDFMHDTYIVKFPDNKQLTTVDGLKNLKNSKFGDYAFLSDKFMKLSKNWRSREGRNISTKENPYGVDRGDAFMAGDSDKEFHAKPEFIVNCNKGGCRKFMYKMNCYNLFQSYNMVMDKVLSEKTDLKQKAYLKLMLEKNMQGPKINSGFTYGSIIKNTKNLADFEHYLFKGKYNKAILDVNALDSNNLPENYEYFKSLSDEECDKILNTPYSELDANLKNKVDQMMPDDDTMNKKFENYHKDLVKKGYEIAYSNNNTEVFNLDIINSDKVDDPEAVNNLKDPDKRKVEDTFNLVMGPVLMEEIITEELENEKLQLQRKKTRADIASHFIIIPNGKKPVYADGSQSKNQLDMNLDNGYKNEEIVQMKAKVLKATTQEKGLAYMRYQKKSPFSMEITTKSFRWNKAAKPEEKRQKIDKPVVEEKAVAKPEEKRQKIDKPVVEEKAAAKPEEKKPVKDKPAVDKKVKNINEINENIKPDNHDDIKNNINDEVKDNNINKNIKIDDKTNNINKDIKNDDKTNNINKDIKNDDKTNNINKDIKSDDKNNNINEDIKSDNANNNIDNKINTGENDINTDSNIKENDNLINDNNINTKKTANEINPKAADDLEERKAQFDESVRNYTSALIDMDKVNALAVYSREFLGSLKFRDEIHHDESEAVNTLKEKLSNVAALSDESIPSDAKKAISELGIAINQYLISGSGLKNKVIRKNCKELTTINEYVNKAINDMKVDNEEISYRDIMQKEYRVIYRNSAQETKKQISDSAEAQNKKLVTVIKKLKEEYKFLKTCNKHPEGNSAQFNDMFEAAGKAAELTVDSSPMEIRSAMGQLMAASAVYMKKINEKGGGILGAGKKKGFYRLSSAKDLHKIARSALMPVDRMTYPYESFTNQVRPELKKLGTGKNDNTVKKAENNKAKNTKVKS